MQRLENGLTIQRQPQNIAIVKDVGSGLDEMLREDGLTPRRIPNSKDSTALTRSLLDAEADIAITRTSSTFSAEVLEHAGLSAIQAACKGPHVDMRAAEKQGIEVLKVDANRAQVVALLRSCILSAATGLGIGNTSLREGDWCKPEVGKTILDPAELNLGIVGYGDIGQLAAETLGKEVAGVAAFNHRFSRPRKYDERLRDHAAANQVHMVDNIRDLMAASDVLSLHIDEIDAHGNSNTRKITPELLEEWSRIRTSSGFMPPIFINIARAEVGPSLEELDDLLKRGLLHSAWVDAHRKDLEVKGAWKMPPNAHPGLQVTPHIGGSGAPTDKRTEKAVRAVLGTWIREGSFKDTSRVFPHEILDASNLAVPGTTVVRIARSTKAGSALAVESAIRAAGMERLDDVKVGDLVAGKDMSEPGSSWSVVPHIYCVRDGHNYQDAVRRLAHQLDGINKQNPETIVAARFIPTNSAQKAQLIEMGW